MAFFKPRHIAPEPVSIRQNDAVIPPGPVLHILEKLDERRPCWVNGRRAMFHRWANSAHPVPPRGVQPSENARYFQFRATHALVEYEDGTVARVYPNEIRFADGGGFADIAWLPMNEEDAGENG